MPKLELARQIEGGNVAISQLVAREADGIVAHEVPVAPGKAGTLSTKNSNSAGIATVSSGHGIVQGDTVDVYWAAAAQFGLEVTAVTSTTITFVGPAAPDSAPLPDEGTAIVVSKQTLVRVHALDEHLATLALELHYAERSESAVSRLAFVVDTDELGFVDSRRIHPNTPIVIDVAGGESNVFLAGAAEFIKVSNASAANAATFKIIALHDASVIVEPFTPAAIEQLALWIDPSDATTMDLLQCAFFGASGNYLATADHADFDFSSGAQFSVEVWKNKAIRTDGLNGLDDGYCGQWVHGTSASWALASGGSVNQGPSLRFLLAISANGNDFVSITTPTTGFDWSQALVVYDGTQGTPTDRVRIYLDGALVNPTGYIYSDTDGSTIPATPQNSSSVYTVGRGLSVHGLADAALSRNRVWEAVLDADDADDLWNSGEGLMHADLAGAGLDGNLVVSYDLTEPSGTRVDSSGNGHDLAETGGSVASVNVVMELRDKGPDEFVFHPQSFGQAPPFADVGFAGAPYLNPTGIGGAPCLDFRAFHGLRAAAAQAIDLANFDIVEACRWEAFASSETFLTVSADEATALAYWFTGEVTNVGQHFMWMRWRDNNTAAFNTNARSDQPVSLATDYINNWRVLGAGDDLSHGHRLNGVQSELTFAAGSEDKSLDDVAGRDNLALGCLPRSDGTSPGLGKRQLHGQVVVAGPGLTVAENRQLENWVAGKHNLLLLT